jgi:cellulose synthase (UDP-forming)
LAFGKILQGALFMMQARKSLGAFRVLALLAVAAGGQYIIWRYAASMNQSALWLAVPFILAETYGIVDMSLFMLTMWKPRCRVPPPAPPAEGSVDVFITTFNEESELVERTARAACAIRWGNKKVFVLDDGARPAIRELAERLGCGYISRGEEWAGKPRHAKAGNVNNALLQTEGDFILILDADQIPAPEILEKTLGYFEDPLCAFVQTPQMFYNIPPGDPFGTDAPLFYGPILEGKDGWNAAFFCGSNAVLRREALMRLGVTTYVKEVERAMRLGLKALLRDIRRLPFQDRKRLAIRTELLKKLEKTRKSLLRGKSLSATSDEILEAIRDASKGLTRADLDEIRTALKSMAIEGDLAANMADTAIRGNQSDMVDALSSGETMGITSGELDGIDLTRGNEAIPVQALYTESITEDMATALRLHALGFRSVFHNEVLALGLAPEDLGTSLKQRLRWAQGTIQVFMKENPLFLKGLSFPQRLMYFATIFSYFSGFFNFLLLAAPIVWFFTAIAPVAAWSLEFFARLIPFLVLNRLAFMMITKDLSCWRSEQYNLALFPLWIKAVVSVFTGQNPKFVVTSKQRQSGTYLRLVLPQILVIASTIAGILFAGLSLMNGWGSHTVLGYIVNSFWGIYNCIMLSVVVRAAVYQPPAGWKPQVPEYGSSTKPGSSSENR